MSGSVCRLKAVAKAVGREVVRELRKNKLFQLSWRQRKDWRQDDKSSVHSGQEIFVFLRRGVTRAVLKTSGNTPEDREKLTRTVREGRRVSRHSTSRRVGIGSS